MSTLTIMQGLPGSGKTTEAIRLLKKSGNSIRLNKDLLREMLHGNTFTFTKEEWTRLAARSLAKTFLEKNVNVIIDDTNLNQRTLQSWKELGKEASAKVSVCKMDTPIEECIKRDETRQKRVGWSVITAMALQNSIYPKPEKGFILCDLDGTLCDIKHRLIYSHGSVDGFIEKDWKMFFSLLHKDELRYETFDLLKKFKADGHEIIFVSARPEDYKEETLKWLEEKGVLGAIKPVSLIMRRSGDKRDDTVVKQDIYDTYFKDKYPIHVVIDDRPRVLKVWQKNGLETIDVGEGIDF